MRVVVLDDDDKEMLSLPIAKDDETVHILCPAFDERPTVIAALAAAIAIVSPPLRPSSEIPTADYGGRVSTVRPRPSLKIVD